MIRAVFGPDLLVWGIVAGVFIAGFGATSRRPSIGTYLATTAGVVIFGIAMVQYVLRSAAMAGLLAALR